MERRGGGIGHGSTSHCVGGGTQRRKSGGSKGGGPCKSAATCTSKCNTLPRMLRRISRALRLGLFIVTVLLLAWMPASFLTTAFVELPRPDSGMAVYSNNGKIVIWSLGDNRSMYYTESAVGFGGRLSPANDKSWPLGALRPMFEHRRLTPPSSSQEITLTLPLWLLAAGCLAWPLTSFLIARRRRRRGFAVELTRRPREEPQISRI